jgi:hypothetical protein
MIGLFDGSAVQMGAVCSATSIAEEYAPAPGDGARCRRIVKEAKEHGWRRRRQGDRNRR